MSDDRKARYRDISDGLLRQRRNLLLMSIIMPLFFISGATVEKINILGTVITVNRPEVIKYSIIVLFLYFFLRYWQYYKEETYVKDMLLEMKKYLYHIEQSYLVKRIRKKAHFLNQDILNYCFADPRYDWGGRYAAIPKNKDKAVFPFFRECEFYIYPDDRGYGERTALINDFHQKLSEPEHANWHPLKAEGSGDEKPHFYRECLRYSILRFKITRLLGMFRYMLNESYFTDYQLPFIVAFTSIVAVIGAKFI